MLFAHKNKPWFTLQKGGLLELDWQRLSERIVLAKQAIGERWPTVGRLQGSPSGAGKISRCSQRPTTS
jgi:hypothetical protein